MTKLLGLVKWTYFYLYVILDVFSRYEVGWMVAKVTVRSWRNASLPMREPNRGLEPGRLTIRGDRGSSLIPKPGAFLLADLGFTTTYSRPHVSDGNPYSESHFRSLKYRPEFLERFGSLQDARSFSEEFFAGYNNEHGHSRLCLLCPAVVYLRLWCITGRLRKRLKGGGSCSMPLTALIRNASGGSHLHRCPRRRRSGSTNNNELQRIKLRKLRFEVSQAPASITLTRAGSWVRILRPRSIESIGKWLLPATSRAAQLWAIAIKLIFYS